MSTSKKGGNKKSRTPAPQAAKEDDGGTTTGSICTNTDMPLPSLVNLLFYTLVLPIFVIIMFGKSFEPDLNNGSFGGNKGSTPGSAIKAATNAGSAQQPAQSHAQYAPNPNTGSMAKQEIKADGSTISSESTGNIARDGVQFNASQFDEATAAFLQEWNYILTHRNRRYLDAPEMGLHVTQQKLADLRKKVASNPNDWISLAGLIEELRTFDKVVSAGGIDKEEIILCSKRFISLVSTIANAENNSQLKEFVCGISLGMGITEFLADKFMDSIDTYSKAIDSGFCNQLQTFNLMDSRITSYIVFGMYEEIVRDSFYIMDNDKEHFFTSNAINALVRVLSLKDIGVKLVPGGWDILMKRVDEFIPTFLAKVSSTTDGALKQRTSLDLARMYRAKFSYYEKIKDYPTAYQYLEESIKHKGLNLQMKQMPTENHTLELQQIKRVFTKNLFDTMVLIGQKTSDVPIFIVGTPRSGSTLLESVLDAHPSIAGLSEDSVFAGMHLKIQKKVAEIAQTNDALKLQNVVGELADEVEKGMFERWERKVSDRFYDGDVEARTKPLKLADKSLTNYKHIGFIHMLFPKAAIFHVSREPMDSVFSNFKHDFYADGLNYSDSFDTLAPWYKAYRQMMDHWDEVLPGRIFHVRYEELVNDFDNIARAIIAATGLPWDDAILDFNTRKQATNTFSTTQVKDKIYTGSIYSWKKYETQLQPIVQMLGEYISNERTTTLPGYSYNGPKW